MDLAKHTSCTQDVQSQRIVVTSPIYLPHRQMLHDSASISLSTFLRWTAVLDNAIAIVPAQCADVQNDQNDAVCIDVRLLLQGQLTDSPVANLARIWWSVRHDACFFPPPLHLASEPSLVIFPSGSARLT